MQWQVDPRRGSCHDEGAVLELQTHSWYQKLACGRTQDCRTQWV